MTIRSDLTIDWSASPRIIEVAAPSTELTIQDLYDTLRHLGVEAIDEPEIIDGSGKESLGAGILVGLTIKLLNAKVKFEDRTEPNWVVCSIGEGNLVAVDEGGGSINPIEPSAYTQVQLVMSAAGTITITGSGVMEQDKIDIANKVEVLTGSAIKAKTDHLPSSPADESTLLGVKAKTDYLPTDPTSKSDLEVAHGVGSWEGATPTQVWGHSDRRLSSRDIESEIPDEHLPSEEQIEDVKGAGWTIETLKLIKELIEKIEITPRASFNL